MPLQWHPMPTTQRNKVSRKAKEPSGSADLSDVQISQRKRLVEAMVEVVASRTFSKASVAHVLERAGVSRKTYYEFFSNKLDCFIASYREGVLDLQRAIVDSARDATGWQNQLTSICTAFAEFHAQRPAFARVFFIEVFAAGPVAMEERNRAFDGFVEMYKYLHAEARKEWPELEPLKPERLASVIGAIGELSRLVIERDGPEALAARGNDFAALSWTILRGAEWPPSRK